MHFQHAATGQIGSFVYPDWPTTATHGVPSPWLHVNGVKDVLISPAVTDAPADAYTRITGWDAPSCHSVVACHGLMY
jgi:hypothetical protein